MNSDEIENAKKQLLPEHFIEAPEGANMLQIEYYYYSFAKMKGIYPVSKNYVFDENDKSYEDEPEKSSIKQSLK